MPRGTPDYGYPLTATIQTSTDLNSVITALAGLAPIDGLGRVAFMDTFKSGVGAWSLEYLGGGAAPVVDWTVAPVGGGAFSAKLDPQVNNGLSTISIVNHLLITDNFGAEYSFCASATSGDVELYCSVGDANEVQRQARFRYSPSSGDVTLMHDGGNVVIANVPISFGYTGFMNRFKVVGSLTTGKYLRFLAGGLSVDISAYDLNTASSNVAGSALILVRCTGVSAINVEPIFVKAVIITSSEPN